MMGGLPIILPISPLGGGLSFRQSAVLLQAVADDDGSSIDHFGASADGARPNHPDPSASVRPLHRSARDGFQDAGEV